MSHAAHPARPASSTSRSVMVWRLLSALALLAMGGIHLYLVLTSTGGVLGMLFVLNAIGGLVLAIAITVLQGRLLQVATVLGLLFMAGTLAALVIALTSGSSGSSPAWTTPWRRPPSSSSRPARSSC